ncbi:putative Phosphomannomutase [Alphaproteobacteria bacterium]
MYSCENHEHNINAAIIKEYDIRGLAGHELGVIDAYHIGRRFAEFFINQDQGNNRRADDWESVLCIGRDYRQSSPALAEAFIEAVLNMGVNVINLGAVPTPAVYFAAHSLPVSASVMVTGSHNSSGYNGFKLIYGTGPIFGAKLKNIMLCPAICGGKAQCTAKKRGFLTSYDIENLYIRQIIKSSGINNVQQGNQLKIVWSVGNTTAVNIIKNLIAQIPGQHYMIDSKHVHEKKCLDELKQVMTSERCHVGITLDHDADRIIAVDPVCGVLNGDQLLLIFAYFLLKEIPGSKVLVDVKTSQIIIEKIRRYGGIPVLWKTGHSPIKAKMQEDGISLAGEVSGHIYDAHNYLGYDDGIFAACKLISFMLVNYTTITNTLAELPLSFITREIRIECANNEKYKVIQNLQNEIEELGLCYINIDGIRCSETRGWWLVRASNTEECLSIRVEVYTMCDLQDMHNQLLMLLNRVAPYLNYTPLMQSCSQIKFAAFLSTQHVKKNNILLSINAEEP